MTNSDRSRDEARRQPQCDVPGCRIRLATYRDGSVVESHFHGEPAEDAKERLVQVYRILLESAVRWRERERAAGRDPDSPSETARRKQALVYARARTTATMCAEIARLREIAEDKHLEVATERVIAERADRAKGTPGVEEAIARAEAGEYGTLIVSDHRSLGRHFREHGDARDRLQQLGVNVVVAYSFLPMRAVSEEWFGEDCLASESEG
jgi:DNA invertase Pin-like site-specific DNA recombinase